MKQTKDIYADYTIIWTLLDSNQHDQAFETT